jgi:phage/plasmid-like protein (TIGR03299 family)
MLKGSTAMSRETLQHLNTVVLVGNTDQRGHAWHYRADLQADEPNHYPGPIPIEDVRRRLFDWLAIPRRVAVELPADPTTATHFDAGGQPQRWVVQAERQAITRSDTDHVMGLFSDGYMPHQYQQWLLNTVAAILDDGLSISSAGLLREGAVAWVEVSMPETIQSRQGFPFRPNLLACTSFDGSLATTFKRTVTATVCDNTMSLALAERGERYRVKHSRHSQLRLGEARDALNIVYRLAEDFQTELDALTATTVSDAQWRTFLVSLTAAEPGAVVTDRQLAAADRKRASLDRLWRDDDRVTPWKNTALGVVQAVNTWTHHEAKVIGDRAQRNMLKTITDDFDVLNRDTLTRLDQVLQAG